MGETVYLDLLFLINFSMDTLALFLSARILHRPLRLFRLLAAGALGGVYACLSLFLPVSGWIAVAADILVCLLLGAVAFVSKGNRRELFVSALTFTAVSMALGGIMTALFTLLNRLDLPLDTETSDGDGISVFLFAILAAVSAIATLLGGKFFASRSSKKTATVTVTVGGNVCRLSALVDSGNLLCEPVSGKPCVVVELSVFERIFSERFLRGVKLRRYTDVASASEVRGVCLIPTRTASGQGMLIAFRPDRMTVDAGKGEREVDAYVALCELGQSAMGQKALLPNVLLS